MNTRWFRLAWLAWAPLALSNTLVVPNTNLVIPGNSTSPLPAPAQSLEFQEILGGGQFHSNPITITGISFRAAVGAGATNGSIGSLSLTLSTSPNIPNGTGANLMSTTFAKNVGSDKTLVFSGTNIPLKDAGCTAPGPCEFDLNIVFQTPFTYAAGKGALLLDFVETNIGGSGAFDSVSFSSPGGGVATVVGTAGSATGTFAYSGPVVQVIYATTAPIPTGVVNVASNIPPGMPNYGIAQGSLFAVYGSNMGPANLAVSSLPLQTTGGLSGTSITVNVGGTGISAPIYFTRNDIVVAVMPSNAPTGNGAINLFYNGQSGSMPITVVQSNFGISNNVIPFTDNGIGVVNTAAVTFPDFKAVTTTHTAKPGDVLTVWGTGLGPTPNNGGDTGAPPGGNIGTAPQVFIGGVASPSITYWGRAPGLIPGLDQINFEVPANAPLGCNVSIVVQTANGSTPIVSNAPTIALSDTDFGTCSDPTGIISPSNLALSSAKILVLEVAQTINVTGNSGGPPTGTVSGRAEVDAFQLNQPQIATLAPAENITPSFGSCSVGINGDPSANGPFDPKPLDSGSTVTLTPPSAAAVTLDDQRDGPGFYRADLGTTALPPNGTFTLQSGTWGFSNGSGGSDVSPLNFNFPVPQPIQWMNRGSLIGSNIPRATPLTILWSGGDSNGYVDIQGSTTGLGASGLYFIGFECAAPVSAGQFAIPSSILLAMPPNAFGNLQITTKALPNIVGKVPGFDISVTSSHFAVQIPVVFK